MLHVLAGCGLHLRGIHAGTLDWGQHASPASASHLDIWAYWQSTGKACAKALQNLLVHHLPSPVRAFQHSVGPEHKLFLYLNGLQSLMVQRGITMKATQEEITIQPIITIHLIYLKTLTFSNKYARSLALWCPGVVAYMCMGLKGAKGVMLCYPGTALYSVPSRLFVA